MQNTQENYRRLALGGLLVVALVFAAETAFSAGIAERGKPDPILAGTADGPCDAALGQPDLTPGTDVEGHQIASADIQNGPVPFGGQIAVPLRPARGKGGNSAFVMVDGKKLDPLLSPKSPCH